MNIWSIFLTVVIIGEKKAFSYLYSSRNLVCFSHSTGDQTKDCDQTRGFKTCFTRYNSEGKVTGRGCSTKRSTYIKCETHSYGPDNSDKFCYCSRTMCNAAPRASGDTCLVTLATASLLVMLVSSWCSVTGIQSNVRKRRRKVGFE